MADLAITVLLWPDNNYQMNITGWEYPIALLNTELPEEPLPNWACAEGLGVSFEGSSQRIIRKKEIKKIAEIKKIIVAGAGE